MKTLANRLILTLAVVVLTFASNTWAADKGVFETSPKTNNGQKWRIAYYEGGEYIDYQLWLTATVRGMMKLGWIETSELPKQSGEETETLWKWLVSDAKSAYVEFLADGHYSAKWDEAVRPETVKSIISRMNDTDDVDLIIAMGTWAGTDLANDQHSTDTMVLSASDPLSAGIIKSVEDSGFAHVHATVDPTKFERQVRVFHEIIGFKKLGVAYEDTVNGRSYAAIDLVEKMAAERGFEVVKCHAVSDVPDVDQRERDYAKCFENLAKEADAIYVTYHGGVSSRSIPNLVSIANKYHVPTFSQAGATEVQAGFMASLSQAGFRYIGEFHATTFAKVFNGARPNDLDQLFEEPPKIALNLKTAELIGFDPPVVLLGAADEIFHDIGVPQ